MLFLNKVHDKLKFNFRNSTKLVNTIDKRLIRH